MVVDEESFEVFAGWSESEYARSFRDGGSGVELRECSKSSLVAAVGSSTGSGSGGGGVKK